MTESTFKGSCLCGSVKYEITGEAKRFYHCHCTRCRKASGTGHASNILLKPATINWLNGEELISKYRVPDAKRFASWFCSQCGSSVPRFVPEIESVVIPAGSLDSEPSVQPEARIFWDSRAEWSCESGELPHYPEYPKHAFDK